MAAVLLMVLAAGGGCARSRAADWSRTLEVQAPSVRIQSARFDRGMTGTVRLVADGASD